MSSQQESPKVPDVSLEELMQGAERFRRRELDELVEQWGSPEDVLANLPKAQQPTRLSTTLLPYQLQVCIILQTAVEEECVCTGIDSDVRA